MAFSWRALPAPFFALAPMEDVTDTVFRRVVARCGRPHVFFTEFASADGLCSQGRDAVAERLRFTEEERPIVAQVWGTDPERHFRVARWLAELGFDGVDINMGCPVKKIVRGGGCSALIENPNLAAELIRAAREGAGSLPLSVKTRCGFRDWRTEQWAGFLLEQKPDALIVHARIAKDESRVPARWEEIGRVVALREQMKSDVVIIGNGDVTSLAEARDKCGRYGVEGVMIGRAIFQTPFLFGYDTPPPWAPEQRLELLLIHLALYRETWGERHYQRMKKFYKMYAAGFPGAVELRTRLMEVCSTREAEALVHAWLERMRAEAAAAWS